MLLSLSAMQPEDRKLVVRIDLDALANQAGASVGRRYVLPLGDFVVFAEQPVAHITAVSCRLGSRLER
jgi:hypothetical protein